MKIIFGLGNPGPKYVNNRHNIGQRVLDELGKITDSSFKNKVKLEKSKGFMNNSGISVEKALRRHGVLLEDTLLVHDDVDLPLGKIRFRKSGSCGGHRGVASAEDILNTQDINRLKLGIGKDVNMDTADYVLADFLPQEQEALAEIVARASSACVDWVESGMDFVMRKYN